LFEAQRYNLEGRGFASRWCHCNFSLKKSFPSHYDPGVYLPCKRNEYQEFFLRVKAAVAQGWQTYRLCVPILLKSGSLILVKPSMSVQACTRIALLYFA